jgi:hypothetical protein
MPHVYVVREPFGGFEKGQVISHEQAHADPTRHTDHHTVRVWRDDPAPAAVISTTNDDPVPDAVISTGNSDPVSPPVPAAKSKNGDPATAPATA